MNGPENQTDFYASTFLGKTLFKHTEGRIARLKPIAIAAQHGWQLIADVMSRFPSEGIIFCREDVAVGRPEGTYFTFKLVLNEGQDRYRAIDVEEPLEVLRDFGRRSPEDQRRIAVLEGLSRGHQRSPKAVLPLKGNRYVLPPLENRSNGRWTVAHGQDLARIPVYAADSLFDGGSPIDNGRSFVLPGQAPAKRVGLLNWQVDGDFLETVIGQLRKIASKSPDPALEGLTKGVIGRLRSALTAGEPLADQIEESESVRERLSSFLPALEGVREGGRRIAEALLSHPSVKSEVTTLSQAERDGLRHSLEAEIRTEVTGSIEAELQSKRLEVEEQNRVHAELKAEIESATVRLGAVRTAYEEDLVVLREGLADFRTDVARTDAALGRIRDLAQEGPVSPPVSERTADGYNWQVHGESGALTCGADVFARGLLAAANAMSISRHQMIGLDVAVRSGEVPCLTGRGAEVLLATYARFASAGSLHRHPVDATLLGPDDLLRRPGSGGATPMMDAWNAALQSPGSAFIVCVGPFDGFPLPKWFEAFADLYRLTRPRNLLVVATASGDASSATGIVIEAKGSVAGAMALLRGDLDELPGTSVDMATMAGGLAGAARVDAIKRLSVSVADDFDARRALARAEAAWLWESLYPGVIDDVAKWPTTSSLPSIRIEDGHFAAADNQRSDMGHD